MERRLYRIRFFNEERGIDETIDCLNDWCLLNSAEEYGLELPCLTRTGNDLYSAARLITGEVDQSQQNMLEKKEIDAGYILLDVAYPRSDCVIETHQRENVERSMYG